MYSPAVTAAWDQKAFDVAERFIMEHPDVTYQEVTKQIPWYFDDKNFDLFSPWIYDWIMGCFNKSDKTKSFLQLAQEKGKLNFCNEKQGEKK